MKKAIARKVHQVGELNGIRTLRSADRLLAGKLDKIIGDVINQYLLLARDIAEQNGRDFISSVDISYAFALMDQENE